MSEQDAITIENFLSRLNAGWTQLQDFIGSLTEEQLTVPTDTAGWTVKDHLIHLAVWQAGITALLNHKTRWEGMGISREQFLSEDYDATNSIIQQQHKDEPLFDVLATLRAEHQRLLDTLEGLTDEDIARPYKHYAPDSDRDAPVVYWMAGNTYGHYEEHLPWMQAIVDGAS